MRAALPGDISAAYTGLFAEPIAMKIFNDELTQPRRDPIRLRQYLWRAATVCRRKGLRYSAITIVNNMDELVNALARPVVASDVTRPHRGRSSHAD
jgi:hypothetical protein